MCYPLCYISIPYVCGKYKVFAAQTHAFLPAARKKRRTARLLRQSVPKPLLYETFSLDQTPESLFHPLNPLCQLCPRAAYIHAQIPRAAVDLAGHDPYLSAIDKGVLELLSRRFHSTHVDPGQIRCFGNRKTHPQVSQLPVDLLV